MIKQITISTQPNGTPQITVQYTSEDAPKPMEAIMILVQAITQISAEALKQTPQSTTIKPY
jgi:S-adenosylmethionine synthetase